MAREICQSCWSVLSQSITYDDWRGEFGETGWVKGPDSKAFPVVNFWGYRRTLCRSLLLCLNKKDWPFNSSVGKIIKVLDNFKNIEELHAIRYSLKGFGKIFVVLYLWRKWLIARYLKDCMDILSVLEVDLTPSEASEEVRKALDLISIYLKERANYSVLPRYFTMHMGRVALWVVCPNLLQKGVPAKQITKHAFKLAYSWPVSVRLLMSFSLRLFLLFGPWVSN